MPDLDQIKQAEQGGAGPVWAVCQGPLRQFRRLAARPAAAITPTAALRLCLERIVGPCRERAVEFVMPPIRNAADLASAMAAVAAAAAQGVAVTPREAMQLGHVVEGDVRAVEATEFERRLRALEAADAASP